MLTATSNFPPEEPVRLETLLNEEDLMLLENINNHEHSLCAGDLVKALKAIGDNYVEYESRVNRWRESDTNPGDTPKATPKNYITFVNEYIGYPIFEDYTMEPFLIPSMHRIEFGLNLRTLIEVREGIYIKNPQENKTSPWDVFIKRDHIIREEQVQRFNRYLESRDKEYSNLISDLQEFPFSSGVYFSLYKGIPITTKGQGTSNFFDILQVQQQDLIRYKLEPRQIISTK